MRVHDTCRAEIITDVRVGRAAVPPADEAAQKAADEAKAKHEARLAEIAADEKLDDLQKRDAVAAENEAYGGPETQDIIHLTMTGGEKRSILRSDLQFSPVVTARENKDFPKYAQKKPVDAKDAKPVAADTPMPTVLIGDFLVEDFDLLTDKFVQKIYDSVTFNRYFKASLS